MVEKDERVDHLPSSVRQDAPDIRPPKSLTGFKEHDPILLGITTRVDVTFSTMAMNTIMAKQ